MLDWGGVLDVGVAYEIQISGEQIMRLKFAVSLVLLLTAAAITAVAQDRTIDDFTTGPFKQAPVRCGKVVPSSQNGSMLGGNRSTGLSLSPANACGFAQPNSYEFKLATKSTPSAFLFNAGFGAGPRVDMTYGFGAPMHIDFTPYDRIRLNFLGLTQTLNFNILLYSGGPFVISGCNVTQLNAPFSIEVPLSTFKGHTDFDITNVTNMDFIFGDGNGVIGGVTLGVSSIELSHTAKPGAISCP
jgi:hypothetical protein